MTPLIYVSGPYMAENINDVLNNVNKAEVVGQEILRRGMGLSPDGKKPGLLPVIPHKLTSMWDRWGALVDWTHQDWMDRWAIPLLDRCDAMVMVDGWRDSKGCNAEVDHCIRTRKLLFYSVDELFDSLTADISRLRPGQVPAIVSAAHEMVLHRSPEPVSGTQETL